MKQFTPLVPTHLEASSNYTILHFKDGRKVISGYSLEVFEEHFKQHSFIRIDRSNLVHRTFIEETLTRGQGQYFKLKNKIEILIPRRRRSLLKVNYPNLF